MLGVVIFKGCSALAAALFQAQNNNKKKAGIVHVCSAEKVSETQEEDHRTILEWQDPDGPNGGALKPPVTRNAPTEAQL